MIRRKLRWVVGIIAAGLLVIWLTNRQPPLSAVSIPARPTTTRASSWVLSVTPTPRRWDRDGFLETFETAKKVVPTVCLPDPVDWWHARGADPTESKPYRDSRWQQILLEQHDLRTFIQLDPYPKRRGPIPNLPKQIGSASFGDPVLRRAFIADARQRVELYRPAWLCLAMEINAYHEQHPEDFDRFVSLFREARDAVKQIDREVMVFVSVQYEQSLGLYGGEAGLPAHPPQWDLMRRLAADADALGISSYPLKSLSPPRFSPAEDLPADYYARLADHVDKPIVFAELGWASDPRFGGSPQDQAKFLRRLPVLLKRLDVRLINYNFLFDAKGFGEVFESMGLIDAEGKVKPALEAWLEL